MRTARTMRTPRTMRTARTFRTVGTSRTTGTSGTNIAVMDSWSIRARAAKGAVKSDKIQDDADVLSAFLEDAAHYPGGNADGLVAATCEADVAHLLRGTSPVLCIGAQSSLTGGATPMGEVLLTTSRLNRIIKINSDSVR